MSHRSKEVLDAFVAALTGLSTTGDNVDLTRAYPWDKEAAITVRRGTDSVQQYLTNTFIDREFEVVVTLHVRVSADQIDIYLSQMAGESHVAIMADPTLGLSFVEDVDLIQEAEPAVSGEAETPTALMEQRWRVQYRHNISDPSA